MSGTASEPCPTGRVRRPKEEVLISSNIVARYLTTSAAERQQDREIAAVVHKVELAEIQVAGIGHVTKRAMYQAAETNVIRQAAEQLAPDGAEIYAMIAVAGAVEMTTVISRMNRPDRRV